MVKTLEKAMRIQAKRVLDGRTGLAYAVKRFLKREKLNRNVLG